MSEIAKKKTTPRKTPTKKKVATTEESPRMLATHQEVELLAYQLWESGGRQHGHDAQDWLRAEQQLKN